MVPGTQCRGEFRAASHIVRPLRLAPKILVKLVERPEGHSGGLEEDGEHGLPHQETRVGGGQPSVVVAVTPVDKEVHGPQDETDEVHDHTPNQGRLVLVQVNVSDEAEDDTGHGVLQPSDQALKGGHKAVYITRPGTHPGHFHGIKHRSHD